MKKIILSLVLVATAFITNEIQAQHNAIKTGVFDPILGVYGLEFEHSFNWSTSYQVGAAIITPANYLREYLTEDVTVSGHFVSLQLRKYKSKDAVNGGTFGGPHIHQTTQEQITHIDEGNLIFKQSQIGVGLVAGRKWVIRDVFIIEWTSTGGVATNDVNITDKFLGESEKLSFISGYNYNTFVIGYKF